MCEYGGQDDNSEEKVDHRMKNSRERRESDKGRGCINGNKPSGDTR
jgi:hypothetical protein